MNSLFPLSDELALLRETVAAFARDQIAPRAAAIDKSNEFPRDLWPRLGALGMLGITVKRTSAAQAWARSFPNKSASPW